MSTIFGPTTTVYVPSAVCGAKLISYPEVLTWVMLAAIGPPGPVTVTSLVSKVDGSSGRLNPILTVLTGPLGGPAIVADRLQLSGWMMKTSVNWSPGTSPVIRF